MCLASGLNCFMLSTMEFEEVRFRAYQLSPKLTLRCFPEQEDLLYYTFTKYRMKNERSGVSFSPSYLRSDSKQDIGSLEFSSSRKITKRTWLSQHTH